jgi:hypothetical protein
VSRPGGYPLGSGRDRGRATDAGPRPVAEALEEALDALVPPWVRPGVPAGTPGARAQAAPTWSTVFARWEEVVGATLAGHATPVRVEAGVLVVAVDQPPWATQVRALGPRILARIAELAGDRAERLERIEVVVRRSGDR